MNPYSIDFREKIVQAYTQGGTSIRKTAERFGVSKGFVQKMLKQQKEKGHLQPGKQGGSMKSELSGHEPQLFAWLNSILTQP
jgi:transposase